MSKEKQIEGMTKFILELDTYSCEECDKCGKWQYEDQCDDTCFSKKVAESLYAAGYRKPEGWISVSEKLPKTFDTVLVYDAHTQSVRWATYWGKTNLWCGGRITHWMPLPESPKIEGENNE